MKLADIRVGTRYVLGRGASGPLARGEQWLHALESMGTVNVEAIVSAWGGRRLQVTVITPEMCETRDERLAERGARTTVGAQQLIMPAEEYAQVYASQQTALRWWRKERLEHVCAHGREMTLIATREIGRPVSPIVPSRPLSPIAMDAVGLRVDCVNSTDRRAVLFRLPSLMHGHGNPYPAAVTQEVTALALRNHEQATETAADLLGVGHLPPRRPELFLPDRYVAAMDRIARESMPAGTQRAGV